MRQAQRTRQAEEDAQIVAALRGVGIEVASVYDLVNRPNPKAVPVLLGFLSQDLTPSTKEGVVRALSIKPASKVAILPMIQEFKREAIPDSLRWAIGNAIEVLAASATDDIAEGVLDLALDRRYGSDRQMVVLALGKIRHPRTVDALLQLLDDHDVQGHAIMGLGKLRAAKAKTKLEAFLSHPNAWIRREAKKALKRIARAYADKA